MTKLPFREGVSFCSLSIVLSAICDGQYIPGEAVLRRGTINSARNSLLKGDLRTSRILEVFIFCRRHQPPPPPSLSAKFLSGDPENLAVPFFAPQAAYVLLCQSHTQTGGRMFLESDLRAARGSNLIRFISLSVTTRFNRIKLKRNEYFIEVNHQQTSDFCK